MKPKHHRFSADEILFAIQLVRGGMTYRQAAMEMSQLNVSHKTIFTWVKKFKGAKLTQLKKIAQ